MSVERGPEPISSGKTAKKLAWLWALATAVVCLGIGLLVESGILERGQDVASKPGTSSETPEPNPVASRDSSPSTRKAQPDATETPARPRRASFSPSIRDEPSEPLGVVTLRDAMRNGDPRTPPLARAKAREMPNQAELADPELYAKYEERQQSQVVTSFVDAAGRRLAELDDAIELAAELGDSAGLTPEQLKEGKEKRARLDAMRQRLLREHPRAAK